MTVIEADLTDSAKGESLTSLSPGFAEVIDPAAELVKVCAVDAHEGPVFFPDQHALYFTSLPTGAPEPSAAIKYLPVSATEPQTPRGVVTTLPTRLVAPNGMAAGAGSTLVVCEQGSTTSPAGIYAVERQSGRTTEIVTSWQGRRLNSPNDVVVHSDGSIWFTDPSYGYLQGFRPEPQVGDFVYRFDPSDGSLTVVADRFDKPNGLAFSPDESVLYITDSGANQERGSFYRDRPHHILAFDVAGGRRLRNQRLFAVTAPGFPDGIKVDCAGRVYASTSEGVLVIAPDGEWLGRINVPNAVNFAFGGPNRNVLYITADTAVWAVTLTAKGV